jgi:bifunctional non-homologous end joining protein LigD
MSFIPPQLLASAKAAPEGDRWLHEVKYDGFRLLARSDGGRARLYTRQGNDWTSKLPTIAAAIQALGIERGYLDGELVAIGADGLPDFDLLHRAMRGGRNAPALVYQVFDVLQLNGRDLVGMEMRKRKDVAAELLCGRGGPIRYVEHLVGSGPDLWAHAFELGIEGIVSKRAGSGYRPGVRVGHWLKVKCFHRYRFTISAIHHDSVAVIDRDGTAAGLVPVYSRRTLATLRPGTEVEVQALAWRPGRKLRHARLLLPS